MKNLVIAAVAATALTASVASAADVVILGGLEYTVEAEGLEATAGVEYVMGQATFTPLVTLNDASGDFEFTSVELKVGYTVAPGVDAYAVVEADSDFDYTETTVGVSLRF
jgi:hypothetical protein